MRRESEFLYVRLYNTLKEQILSGLIKPGDYLLSESELCSYYGMSRNSVRKALEQLQNEGLVVKKVGLGTMVPPDLVIQPSGRKVLRLLAPYPAFFVDNGLPLIIDAFLQKHPHVEVKLLSLPAVKFRDSLRSSGEMGVNADLVFASDMQLAQMETVAAFADLSEIVAGAQHGEPIYPKLLSAFRRDGRLVAAPLTFTPVYMACNPQLFSAAGVPLPGPDWTADDFVEAAGRLTVERGGLIEQFGFSLYPHVTRWPVIALQNGLHGAGRNDGRTRSEILRKSLAFLQDMLFRRRIATIYLEPSGHANPFVSGKSAMTLSTLFEMSNWHESHIEFAPLAVPLPFGPEKTTLIQANALMIPAGCRDRQLAEAFLRTALSPEVQKTVSEKTPFLSVFESVNRKARPEPFLQALNVSDGRIDGNCFLHELFPDSVAEDLNKELNLFWIGLESADTLAELCDRMAGKP